MDNIKIFSLIFLFDLNNTRRAAPLLESNPDNNDARDMALFKYNSVMITLAPQFGISPIKHVINEPNIVFLRSNLDRYSSPT